MTRTVLKIAKINGEVVAEIKGVRAMARREHIPFERVKGCVYRKGITKSGDYFYRFKEDWNGSLEYGQDSRPVLLHSRSTGITHWFSSSKKAAEFINYTQAYIYQAANYGLLIGGEWQVRWQKSTDDYNEMWVVHHD